MALNAYLKLKGQQQGDIKGSVVQKGREGKILVVAASHALSQPFAAATGQASGKRQHQPFVVTKPVDAASVPLYQMLAGNELATEWELQFWTPKGTGTVGSASGVEQQYYTVRLSDARVCQIRFVMPDTRDATLLRWTEYEEVSFTYSRIEWLWVASGKLASDTWGSTARATRKKAAAARTR